MGEHLVQYDHVPICTNLMFDISSLNEEQHLFYNEWVANFNKGVYFDLKGNITYIFLFCYETLNSTNVDEMIRQLSKILSVYGKEFPKINLYATKWLADCYIIKEDYEKAFDILSIHENIRAIDTTLFSLRDYLGKKYTLEEAIDLLYYSKQLTNFGLEHREEIKKEVLNLFRKYEQENQLNVIEHCTDRQGFTLSVFSGFFKTKFHDSKIKQIQFREQKFQKLIPDVVKNAENNYREKLGLPKVGEGWISETELYYMLKEIFSAYKVIHHGKPSFLGLQHLDIFIPELKIGVEYQGEQHYKSIDFFGGEKNLELTIERDERKRNLCEMNGIKLFYVYPNYDIDELLKDMQTYFNSNGIKAVFNNAKIIYTPELISYKNNPMKKKNIKTSKSKEEKIKDWLNSSVNRRRKRGDNELLLEEEVLLNGLKNSTNSLEKHFFYSKLEYLYYSFREKPFFIDKYITICLKHLEIYEDFKVDFDNISFDTLCTTHFADNKQHFTKKSYLENFPFKRLAIVYEKLYEYEKAIEICKRAISHGIISDGTKIGFKGRIKRLEKRLEKGV